MSLAYTSFFTFFSDQEKEGHRNACEKWSTASDSSILCGDNRVTWVTGFTKGGCIICLTTLFYTKSTLDRNKTSSRVRWSRKTRQSLKLFSCWLCTNILTLSSDSNSQGPWEPAHSSLLQVTPNQQQWRSRACVSGWLPRDWCILGIMLTC